MTMTFHNSHRKTVSHGASDIRQQRENGNASKQVHIGIAVFHVTLMYKRAEAASRYYLVKLQATTILHVML